jgi:protein-disulfide isomerase
LYTLEHEKNGSSVSDEERVKLAKDLGMNESEFSGCLTEAWYQKTLNNEITEGNRLNLQGTPSVYLNDAPLVFEDSDQLATIIEAALSKK